LAVRLTVQWQPAAIRDLVAMDRQMAQRVRDTVRRYAETGQGSVKRLQGVTRQWRLRVGDWRALFTLDDANRMMIVQRVLPRGGAYR
jgi:mRNA interferase RelE/StbE